MHCYKRVMFVCLYKDRGFCDSYASRERLNTVLDYNQVLTSVWGCVAIPDLRETLVCTKGANAPLSLLSCCVCCHRLCGAVGINAPHHYFLCVALSIERVKYGSCVC